MWILLNLFKFAFVVVAVFSAVAAYADTLNIPDDYITILAGIDASSDADTVLVQPGTYYENINFNGKNIVLGSLFITTQDTSYISKTVIDGSKKSSVVIFESGEDSTAVLSGFTIQNGYAKKGGGIVLYSRPQLECLIIMENTAYGDESYDGGGGIYINTGRLSYNQVEESININRVIINNNKGLYGGGVLIKGCGFMCSTTLIKINNAYIFENDGSGISCQTGVSLDIDKCFIGNNEGSGISGIAISAYISYSIVSSNSGSGVAISEGGFSLTNSNVIGNGRGLYCTEGRSFIVNSIVRNNNRELTSPSCGVFIVAYSNIDKSKQMDEECIVWLEGNIDADPLFTDPENGDFRLSPKSLCIDTGTYYFENREDIYVDLSSEDYHGLAPDMGAYESDYKVTSINIEYPDGFILYPNNPNPFNPQTTISYSLPRASFVQLKIFNCTGQEIDMFINDFRNAGFNREIWDAGKYANGVYFYQLLADGFVQTKKMLLSK